MSQTALMVIDAQIGIIEGPSIGPVYKKEAVLHVLKKIVDKARTQKIPVIFIQDLDVGAGNPEQHKIHPEIAPLAEEQVIKKKGTDAFVETELENVLMQLGVKHLIIAGMKTEFCVDTTCRSATARGFDVTLVADGHSTTDSKVLRADQIIAHHNCNLHGLDNINYFILAKDSADAFWAHNHLAYK